MKKVINTGKFNKRIEILTYCEVEDELGQSKQDFNVVRRCWADMYPVRGAERYEVKRLQEEEQYKCYIRYFSGLNASNYYIRHKDRMFKINSVLDMEGNGTFYEIYCTEIIEKVI